MAMIDARLNYLSVEKHKLLRMHDKKEIGDEEFVARYNLVEEELQKIQKEITATSPEEIIVAEPASEEELDKAAEPIAVLESDDEEESDDETDNIEVKQPKRNRPGSGRKPDDTSFAHIGFIILESGRAHSMEETTLIYKEVFPGKTNKQYYQSISNVIHRVKRGDKRYRDYRWDENAWQMVKKDG